MSWEKVRLGDICKLVTGKTPPTGTPAYFDGDLLWINPSDFNTKYIEVSKRTLTQKAIAEKKCNLLPAGTVVLSCIGDIGKVGILKNVGSSNQQITGLITSKRILPEYLYYYLIHNKQKLESLANKAVVAILNNERLNELEVLIPPLLIQKRIADILDTADALKRKDQELLKKYDELAQAIFIDMFGDPVKNEKGWEVKKLGSCADVGSSVRVFVDELVNIGIPFLRGQEIGAMSNGDKVEPSLFITQEHYNRLKDQGGVPKIGDLLLPSICPDGRIFQVEDTQPFYFKDGRVLWIKTNKEHYIGAFLKFLLKEKFLRNYSNIASGTTFAELKIFALKDLELPVPPISLQIQFADSINRINGQRNCAKETTKMGTSLFNTLIQKAFNGELTIL